MGSSTDERGRLYLPKHVRERYGEEYRIVELPDHVALLPVDDDPMTGLEAAVGDGFDDVDRADAAARAVRNAKAEAEAERAERERRSEE